MARVAWTPPTGTAGRRRRALASRLAIAVLGVLVLGVAVVTTAFAAGNGEIEKWGSAGNGNGQFKEPALFGVDPANGNVFAGSIGSEEKVRIQELEKNGTFKSALNIPGVAETKPRSYVGFAVDPTSHVAYLLEGCGVTSGTPACKSTGLATNGYAANRILAFTGSPLGEGDPIQLTLGAEALLEPEALAVDPTNGHLVVLAEESDRHKVIEQLSSTGTVLSRYTDTADQLKTVKGDARSLAVASDGTTYVMTGGNGSGEESTRAWELPESLALLEAVPGFEAAAKAEHWTLNLFNQPALSTLNGPHLALSSNGNTLYWTEGERNAEETKPSNVFVRGYSLTDNATRVFYGGGKYSNGTGTCSIATTSAGIGVDGENVLVFDYGSREEGNSPAFGDRVITFGPGGSGCPVPKAGFTISAAGNPVTIAKTGELLEFEAVELEEANGAVPQEYIWNFGDGTTKTVTATTEEGEVIPPSPEVKHAYCSVPGAPVQVTLEVVLQSAPLGEPVPVSKTLTVEKGAGTTPEPPTARFVASPAGAAPGAAITFNAGASVDPTGGCSPELGISATNVMKEYKWSFGDGASLMTTTPTTTHAFATAGTYTVELKTVSNASLESEPFRMTVAITAPSSGGGGGSSEGGSGGGGGSTTPGGGGGAPTKPGGGTPVKSGGGTPEKKLTPMQKALVKCKKLKGKSRSKCVKKAHSIGKKHTAKGHH
jgi:hypothetical protein